jgi:hypothetical protein
VFWVLVVINTVSPVLQGIVIFIFRTRLLITHKPISKTLSLVIATSFDLVGLSQLISGVLLVASVLKIRAFFKRQQAEHFINVGMLVRHAACFGLFLITTIGYFGAFAMFSSHPGVKFYWDAFCWSHIFYYSGSMMSQVLLCVIFWNLGTSTKEEDEDDVFEVEIEDFDEDAELQANIWNSLVRKDAD